MRLLECIGRGSLQQPSVRKLRQILSFYVNSAISLLQQKINSERVRITLQLTVSQSVCLGVEPNLGL
jgi:hypothetical protein